jgi:ArsR family transcriptional regulator, arsenate/arsenite/antimonite-responsive transcriptional repressor
MEAKTRSSSMTASPTPRPATAIKKKKTPTLLLSEAEAVKALAAISQVQRLRAYRALVQAGLAGLTPGVLAVMLDVPASSLSFHLKELVHAQLAQVEQQGRSLIYRADFSRMTALLSFLSENCCAADPASGSCC